MTDLAGVLATPPAATPRAGGGSAGAGDGFSNVLDGSDGRGARSSRAAAEADGDRRPGGSGCSGGTDGTEPTPDGDMASRRRLNGLAGFGLLLKAERPAGEDTGTRGAGRDLAETEDEQPSCAEDATALVAVAAAPPPADASSPATAPHGAADRDEDEAGTRRTHVATGAAGTAPDAEGVTEDRRAGHRRSGAEADAHEDGANQRTMKPGAPALTVAITAESSVVAPSVMHDSHTVTNLASALAGDAEWRAAADAPPAFRAMPETMPRAPVRDLRIQLRPADLGEVNARLTMRGEQLEIELKVDGGDAFNRLSAEKDKLLMALRALGFKVDDVTIQQQTTTAASAQQGSGGRSGDPSAGLYHGSGRERDAEPGGGGRGRGRDEGRANGDARTVGSGSSAGGVYI